MNKCLLNWQGVAVSGAGITSMTALRARCALALCGLLLMALMPSALAQETVNLRAVPQRVTVPLNFSGTMVISNHVAIAGGSSEVDLTVSGLPAGASGSFDQTAFTNSGGANLTLTLNNVAEGVYNFSVNAGNGATNYLLIPLQVGDEWSAGGTTTNWSDSGNWTGGATPGTNDDVIFENAGGQSSAATNSSTVDLDTTIASLRFALYTNVTYQNLLIDPNVTLSLTGTNGFSVLPDYINDAHTMNVTVSGSSGTLVVSNENANISTLVDNNQKSLLDMSGLGTFTADVSQLGFGDYLLYPNFWNLQTNGYGGEPYRYVPTVKLAMTNVIKAVYTDPYDYTNGTNRAYSLILGNNETSSTSSGAQILLSLGVTNAFLMDSFCISGFGAAGGSVNFNPAFAADNPVAYFRNTDGVSRMSMFCLADAAGPIPAGENTKANGFNGVDFASNHGYVDALVDRFIMARDRWNSAGGGTSQAKMELGQGIFDANTAILGDQENGNQTNTDYCQAQLIVSNTAVFRVNQDLELGYTTAGLNDPSDPGSTYGIINIGPGGTVMANTIGVGGVTKASGLVGVSDGHGQLNQITLKSGALLVVSNNIADSTPNGALGLLSFGGNSTLELFVNGNHSGPYAYVNSLTTSGSGNVIQIGSVTNLTLPAQVPLIQYAAGTPTLSVIMPSGYSGAIINNGPGSTIDVYITAGAPKSLAWRGYVNNSWDTTTKNWLDLNTGLETNFVNLDNVTFDDTTGVPTNINLAASNLIPSAVTVTNNTLNYVFSGSGSISGSATLTKSGTGSLDIEGTTTLSVALDQGLLTGAGTIFSADVGLGATMLYSGTISGDVLCAGTGTSSGTIGGSLDVQASGVFTNLNTINGPITLESGSFMDNSGSINYATGFTSTINAGATLLNLGSINGDLFNDDGILQDASGALGITMNRVNITSGGLFIPGGDGIGTSYIYPGSALSYPGRLSLAAGSTVLIKVNPTNAQPNTVVESGYVDYGPSEKYQTQNGFTLLITNVSTTPFAAGQVFTIFRNSVNGGNPFNDGTSTNAFPIIDPATPGPGLSWDLSHLWNPDGSGNWGEIGVIATPVVNMTNSFQVTASNVVANLSWSADQLGWVLEQQENPISVGLSTNWTRINGTSTVTSKSVTNPTGTNCVFFRLVYP